MKEKELPAGVELHVLTSPGDEFELNIP